MYVFKALGTLLSFPQKMLAFCVRVSFATVPFRSICFVSRLSSYKEQETLGSRGMSLFSEVTVLQTQSESLTLEECWGPCSGCCYYLCVGDLKSGRTVKQYWLSNRELGLKLLIQLRGNPLHWSLYPICTSELSHSACRLSVSCTVS